VDHPINHISLCAGYAGIDLGLRRVLPACRTIAHVEIEAFAIANLVSKMEEGLMDPAPVWTDLHTFPFEKFRGLVDILSGGFPCQPFSQAGARLGVEDPRHLWPSILNGIRRCRPSVVFFENVDGIATAASPSHESVLHNVLCDLEGLDYRATADLYTAQEVGAPHARKRWFILGVANSDDADESGQRSEQSKRPPSGDAAGDRSDLADPHDNTRRGAAEVRRSQYALRSQPDRCGEELADTGSARCEGDQRIRETREEGQPGGHATECGEHVADSFSASRAEGQQRRVDRGLPEESARLRGREDEGETGQESGGRGEHVADSNSCGGGQDPEHREQWTGWTIESSSDSGRMHTGTDEEGTRWPAPPGLEQHAWEEPRTTQPRLGGATDGAATELDPTLNRVERLRMLGNGIVPDQAARAFATLMAELLDIEVTNKP
jgi:DNA (cytosine-5)-methyltransferase 1